MKARILIILGVGAFIALALSMAASAGTFNPADYPFVYRSSASPGATPTAGSGVIWAPSTSVTAGGKISALGGCEFYNSGAAAEYYTIYDAATVAAQNPSNALCSVQCNAASFCFCTGPQPVGPIVNGALVAQNGLSWGSSKAYPGPTAAPDPQSQAICNYIVR